VLNIHKGKACAKKPVLVPSLYVVEVIAGSHAETVVQEVYKSSTTAFLSPKLYKILSVSKWEWENEKLKKIMKSS